MSSGDLGPPFNGWTRPQLMREMRRQGVDVPKDADNDLLVSFALEFYNENNMKVPKPPSRRVSNTRKKGVRRSNKRVSKGSVMSGSNNSKTIPRRVRNDGKATTSNPRISEPRPRGSYPRSNAFSRDSDEPDIIDLLLDQAENDGRSSVNSQSYYSNPATTKVSQRAPQRSSALREQRKPEEATKAERRRPRAYDSTTRNRNRYSGGINDFGEYDPELALEDAAWFAFSSGKPSVHAAKDYAKRFHPIDYDGEKYFVCDSSSGRLCFPDSYCCDVFEERNESDFAKYGVGISLYFKWLKWLFWLFFTISILSFPQLFFNFNGAGRNVDFSNFEAVVFGSTIGNLLDDSLFAVSENNESITFENIGSAFPNSTFLLPGFKCDGEPCRIDRQTVQRMYLSTDIMITLTFMVAAIYLRYFTVIEYGLLRMSFRKIEQYSLTIHNLPHDTTEQELESFLKRQVTQGIHDVVIAKDDGQIIELYLKRGKFIVKMWQIVGECKRLIEAQRKRIKNLSILNIDAYNAKVASYIREYNQKKIELGAKYDEAYAHFIALDEKRKRCRPGENVVAGFVTFENAESYEQGVDALRKKPFCLPKRRRSLSSEEIEVPPFKGKNLRAAAAPPPSTIIWENLEYTSCQRCCRMTLTAIVTVLLLAVTFSIAFLTQSFRVELAATARNQTLALLCDQLDDEVLFGDLQANLVAFNEGRLLQNASEISPELVLECRCSLLPFTDAASAIVNRGNECHDFWSALAPIYIFTTFAAMIISTISLFISVASRALASFEKHKSVQSRELSIGSRLYVALFINVGLALLLVNSNFALFDFSVIGNGRYSDFESEWYANVGVQIFLTTMINSFTPHMLGFMSYSIQKMKQLFAQPKVQAELNSNYLGGEFAASYRYAQQMTAISITMIYGAGIPLFYLLAVCNVAVYYWVDKYLFLRFYQTPPDFGDKLAKFASRLMLLLAPVHSAISIYMYTTPGLFLVSSRDLTDITGAEFVEGGLERYTVRDSLGHFFIMIIGFVVFILDTVFVKTSKAYNHQVGRMQDDKEFESVTKGIASGQFATLLNSYNILERRKYMNSFGISPIFARNNKGISSLFTDTGEQDKETVPMLPHEIRIHQDPDVNHMGRG